MKTDLKKELKNYFTSKTKPSVERFEKQNYLSLVGKGAPDGTSFSNAVTLLYSLAYAIKSRSKQAGHDFVVPPLEGQWWVDGDEFFMAVPRNEWNWKLLVMMPDFVTKIAFEEGKDSVHSKKKLDCDEVKFEALQEGACAQILHKGSFKTEPETIKTLEAFIKTSGYMKNGLHHEIYLSNPNKTASAKMKTILRQPIKKIA